MATRPVRYYHRRDQQQKEIVVEKKKDLSRYCTTCNKSFSRKRDLDRHLRSARVHVNSDNIDNAGLPCRVCAKIFARQDTRRRHEENRICMKRYSQFLRDARAWMHSLCETLTITVVGSTTGEIDYYYNSDISSITTDNTQDDYSVETSSLYTTTLFPSSP